MAVETQGFTYSKVFRNIRAETVEATKELIKSGIWKEGVSGEDKAINMGIWVQECAEIYTMDTPKFYFIGGTDGDAEYERTGGGCYFPHDNSIYIFKKPSLTSLLHEFRHAMQSQLPRIKKFRDSKEEDARAWSLSLYRLAAPKSYKRAVERGLLHFN